MTERGISHGFCFSSPLVHHQSTLPPYWLGVTRRLLCSTQHFSLHVNIHVFWLFIYRFGGHNYSHYLSTCRVIFLSRLGGSSDIDMIGWPKAGKQTKKKGTGGGVGPVAVEGKHTYSGEVTSDGGGVVGAE